MICREVNKKKGIKRRKCFRCSSSHSDLFVVKLLQLGQRLNPLLPHTLLRVGQDVWMHLQESRAGWVAVAEYPGGADDSLKF